MRRLQGFASIITGERVRLAAFDHEAWGTGKSRIIDLARTLVEPSNFVYNVMYKTQVRGVIMSDMVRKQIYIRKQQDEMLKRISEARGVSEAQIVREAIDREIAGIGKRPLTNDRSAWDEILRFLESRKDIKASGEPYKWRREDAYEERLDRFDHQDG
jgi:hypothetical protein